MSSAQSHTQRPTSGLQLNILEDFNFTILQIVGAQPCPRSAVRGALVDGDEDRLLLQWLRRCSRHLRYLRLLGRPYHRHPLPHGGPFCFPAHPQVQITLMDNFISLRTCPPIHY